MQIYRKASLRADGASHPSRTFGETLEVMISPSRLDDGCRDFYEIISTNLPEIYRQSLVRRPFFSLVRLMVRPWPYRGHGRIAWLLPRASPLAPTYAPSHARYAISCHLMYVHPFPHGPPANVATLPAPINCTYSSSKWAVRSYCLNTSSSSKIFRQGGNAWNLFDFENNHKILFIPFQAFQAV